MLVQWRGAAVWPILNRWTSNTNSLLSAVLILKRKLSILRVRFRWYGIKYLKRVCFSVRACDSSASMFCTAHCVTLRAVETFLWKHQCAACETSNPGPSEREQRANRNVDTKTVGWTFGGWRPIRRIVQVGHSSLSWRQSRSRLAVITTHSACRHLCFWCGSRHDSGPRARSSWQTCEFYFF